jgi:hypothetical protein
LSECNEKLDRVIKAIHISLIVEEYFSSKKVPGGYLEIFENPTQSEVKEITKKHQEKRGIGEVRFTADAKLKKVYVWDSWVATHQEARNVIGIKDPPEDTPYLLNGTAYVEDNNKPKMMTWDDFNFNINAVPFKNTKPGNVAYEFLNSVFSYKWDWLEKYVRCSNLLSRSKEKFDMKVISRNSK